MTERPAMQPGRATAAADPTVDDCLASATFSASIADRLNVGPIALASGDSGCPKRPSPPSSESRTPEMAAPSLAIRVPMHLTQVPRG